jgi:hypothetical protein
VGPQLYFRKPDNSLDLRVQTLLCDDLGKPLGPPYHVVLQAGTIYAGLSMSSANRRLWGQT